MLCLKCGRDTKNDRFFCEECLSSMAQYPVKPGTPVNLPQRTNSVAVKKAPRRAAVPAPEEQILHLRRTNRILRLILLLLILALGVASLFFLKHSHDPLQYSTGRNYTIDSSRSTK